MAKKQYKNGDILKYKVPAISEVCPATTDTGKLVAKEGDRLTVEDVTLGNGQTKKHRYFIHKNQVV